MSKTKIQIKTFGGSVLFEYESEDNTKKKTLVEAARTQADLSGADLSGADLSGVYLRGAYLRGADLSRAYLRGAKRNDYELKKTPIQILGLRYEVFIFDKHMEIGCENHTFKEWDNFKPKQILEMDGKDAAKFWRRHKKTLLDLCKSMKTK